MELYNAAISADDFEVKSKLSLKQKCLTRFAEDFFDFFFFKNMCRDTCIVRFYMK